MNTRISNARFEELTDLDNDDLVDGGVISTRLAALHSETLRRIAAYQSSSLQKPEDLDACLGALSSGAMAMAAVIHEKMIEPFLDTLVSDNAHYDFARMDDYLRLLRLIDRYVQTLLQIRQARRRNRRSGLGADDGAASRSIDSPKRKKTRKKKQKRRNGKVIPMKSDTTGKHKVRKYR